MIDLQHRQRQPRFGVQMHALGHTSWHAQISETLTGQTVSIERYCHGERKTLGTLCQGINARMLNTETAAAIASVDYRDTDMDRKRIYTAWDNQDDERTLFRGLDALKAAGIKPDHMMVYVLVGFWDGESHADREYRARALKEYGARPYPMPYKREGATHDEWRELKAFQKWFVQRKDYIPWEVWWGKAKGEPRKLGPRRVSLPLFPEEVAT